MAFRVIVTEPALADIDETTSFMAGESRQAAKNWFDGIWIAFESLKEMPSRYSALPGLEAGFVYLSMPYCSHRILYRVDQANNVVYIVRVYHFARKPLNPGDI